jgi:hypothetical protein
VWCAGEYGYLTELVKQSELAWLCAKKHHWFRLLTDLFCLGKGKFGKAKELYWEVFLSGFWWVDVNF